MLLRWKISLLNKTVDQTVPECYPPPPPKKTHTHTHIIGPISGNGTGVGKGGGGDYNFRYSLTVHMKWKMGYNTMLLILHSASLYNNSLAKVITFGSCIYIYRVELTTTFLADIKNENKRVLYGAVLWKREYAH